jgi:hypothetical protein
MYQGDGSAVPCSLGPNGAPVELAESDVYSSTCDGFGAAGGGITEYLGPVQTMLFVVPGKSRESAITKEAARAVFGAGGHGVRVTPWTDPTLYFVLDATTGVQQLIGRAIGVPAGAFWGTDRGSAANVDALMRGISDDDTAEQAIGILSSSEYDRDRANLKALAFRSAGQECAYLPDSTGLLKDKRNVRDGHYPIWGPLHFFTRTASGAPVSRGAQILVSLVSAPDVQAVLLDAFIDEGWVPACAMSVQRNSELGSLSAYSPPFQCGCHFEATLAHALPRGCAACTSSADCADPARPACNLGYCEIR